MPKVSLPIVVVGAGPAGSSLAVRLSGLGFPVTLIERFKFPREKLCGEFISPECLEHFRELDCLEAMLDAGGDRIAETRFYEVGGRSVAIPSSWFSGGGFALSLSRASMDKILIDHARAAGAEILEETIVTGPLMDDRGVRGVRVRSSDGSVAEIAASLVIDAAGRGRILVGSIGKANVKASRPRFVGFKAHLKSVDMPRGVCEIYAFKGGYAGLSHVENGLANVCFLARASLLKHLGGPDEILDHLRSLSRRAAKTLAAARRIEEWHAVSIPGFGYRGTPVFPGLIAVGDSAAFVDPFTGSGMLMAMETSRLLAGIVGQVGADRERICELYSSEFDKHFSRRLRTSGLIRAVAYEPVLSTAAVSLLSWSKRFRAALARRTRSERSGSIS